MFSNIMKVLKENRPIILVLVFILLMFSYFYTNGYGILQGFSDKPQTAQQAGSQANYNSLAILIQIISLTSIIMVINQVSMANNQSRMEMSYELYKENTEIRQLHESALKQLEKLEESCMEINFKEREDFDSFYSNKKFAEIRRVAYHFEYIGYLVKSKKVHFDLIFDPITFPDWLIKKSETLREKARAVFPDFWEGTEYLYNEYQKARSVSALKRARRLFRFNPVRRFGIHIPYFSPRFAEWRRDRLCNKLDKALQLVGDDPKKQKDILWMHAKYRICCVYIKSKQPFGPGTQDFTKKNNEIAYEVRKELQTKMQRNNLEKKAYKELLMNLDQVSAASLESLQSDDDK